MRTEKILNYANQGQLALLLCIIGAKTEEENERIFPNINQSLNYINGLAPLKGRMKHVDSDEVKKAVIEKTTAFERQISLV